MKRTAAILASALALSALSACSPSEDPAPPARSGIVLFTNDTYVDYTSTGTAAEAYNLEQILDPVNLPWTETVTTFTGTSATEIDAALAGQAVFVIPELERSPVPSLYDALAADARSALASFVSGGGTLVVCYPGSKAVTLLNGVFGFSLTGAGFTSPASLNTAAAAGTYFEGGTTSLTGPSATSSLATGSLPAGSVSMFIDSGGQSAVAIIPYGAGDIVVLGWDFFNAWPVGTADGGWIDAFYSSLTM